MGPFSKAANLPICLLFEIFSCKDAAQQVLMYVCVSVDKVENINKNIQNSFRMFQNVPECMQLHKLS